MKMIKNFLIYLQYTKGLSINTVIRYKKGLEKFEGYLRNRGLTICRPEEIKLCDIYNFIAEMGSSGLSPSSCNNAICAIRAFLQYCIMLRMDVIDPSKILGCKIPEKNIGYFNKDEKRLILKEVNKGIGKGSIVKLRNKLLTYMLLQTGLRCHELAKIKVSEIGESLQVIGKGGKRRTVYLRKELLDMIEEYLSVRKRESEYLFDSTKEGHHLREGSIRKVYMKLTNTLGFHVHAHRFRHTFCTDLLHIPGSNIYNVAKLMGHSRITTTQIYLGTDDLELKNLQFGLSF